MRVFDVRAWAILLAAVMGFVLAMLWFGWGALWSSGPMAAVRQDLGWASPHFTGVSAIIGFASQVVACLGLAWLLNRLGRRGFVSGAIVGASVAVAFVVSAFAANSAWLGTGPGLLAIESAYALVYMALTNGVLGAAK
jgi:hypothetical protein